MYIYIYMIDIYTYVYIYIYIYVYVYRITDTCLGTRSAEIRRQTRGRANAAYGQFSN